MLIFSLSLSISLSASQFFVVFLFIHMHISHHHPLACFGNFEFILYNYALNWSVTMLHAFKFFFSKLFQHLIQQTFFDVCLLKFICIGEAFFNKSVKRIESQWILNGDVNTVNRLVKSEILAYAVDVSNFWNLFASFSRKFNQTNKMMSKKKSIDGRKRMSKVF